MNRNIWWIVIGLIAFMFCCCLVLVMTGMGIGLLLIQSTSSLSSPTPLSHLETSTIPRLPLTPYSTSPGSRP